MMSNGRLEDDRCLQVWDCGNSAHDTNETTSTADRFQTDTPWLTVGPPVRLHPRHSQCKETVATNATNADSNSVTHFEDGESCSGSLCKESAITNSAGSCFEHLLEENRNVNALLGQSEETCKENSMTSSKPLTPEESCCQGSDPAVIAKSERRKRRKPLHPQKSLSPWDPNFCGVTLCFHTVVRGGHSELIITPIYSKNLTRCRYRRSRRLNSESEQEGPEGHGSPVDSCEGGYVQQQVHTPSHNGVGKSCASCGTRRTPLWRDAEDGTPLCNACGIRYRKYRLRCASCWHIPRKDNKVFPACSQCGGVLRFSQARKC